MPQNRSILSGVLLAAITTLCASCGGDSSSPGSPDASTPPSATASASQQTRSAPAFVGTWKTGPHPLSTVVDHLTSQHLAKWTSAYVGDRTVTTSVGYTLKLQAGSLILLADQDGVAKGIEDRQTYTSRGDRITFSTLNGSCAATFRWAVTDDRLRLSLLADTCPNYQGTPDEVYMRALYETVPYVRLAP